MSTNNKSILVTITITVILGAGILIIPINGATIPLAPKQTSLTEVLAALNLTNFLQNSTPQLQQSVANLTQFLQSNANSTSSPLSAAIQQALQNVTGSSSNVSNLTTRLQQFLQNLRSNSNNTSGLNSSISNIQNFLNNATSSSQLQTLINRFGANNITNAVPNLQNQVISFTTFLQSGLQSLLSQQPNLLNQVKSLNQSITNGQLNQTLVKAVSSLTNGQSLSLTQALNSLQQAVNPSGSSGSSTTNPIQQIIQSLQNAMQQFETQLQTFFGSLIPGLSNSTGSTGSSSNLFGMFG